MGTIQPKRVPQLLLETGREPLCDRQLRPLSFYPPLFAIQRLLALIGSIDNHGWSWSRCWRVRGRNKGVSATQLQPFHTYCCACCLLLREAIGCRSCCHGHVSAWHGTPTRLCAVIRKLSSMVVMKLRWRRRLGPRSRSAPQVCTPDIVATLGGLVQR